MSDLIKGGAFLLGPVDEMTVFIPEEFDDMHLMVKNMCLDFMENKVLAKVDEIEEKVEGVTTGLLREAGELGLLSSDIPEEYGGEEADKITTMLITESVNTSGSFATAFGAHTGIGTLPIVYFGNEEQKKRYLPALATGEKIAAYCLTEPEAGSDALNCKTKAVLSEDGKYYILNGVKAFITNAAWADVFIVYAKVDGEKFTAFIVDADTEGVSIDPKRRRWGSVHPPAALFWKMLKCCGKCPLGIGKGHQVAFNILNIDALSWARAASAAACGIQLSTEYALQRVQFKQPIAQFNAIRKNCQMVMLTMPWRA